jgi:hypothetical protein
MSSVKNDKIHTWWNDAGVVHCIGAKMYYKCNEGKCETPVT